ncbi:alpha/beta fold hydrolase [Catenuloplanes indicus]|uniref:Pimeloyl-ACP methyl ester carboxylesterase n=1 Tax=Catenuloplanes indicus TaxID=137267 RepID=A0AAE3VVV6_9ACTN|nr:alpha/beta fold hydrolase [Catenuloplanes indicus]MDQ0365188.1 pimeloyl-ACP methyl ester carboxylesterase [Catenuloplanes indicus]
MTAVLVHGIPETSVVWNGLRAHLGDAVALRLPGFGTPRPAGFGATKEDYTVWLAEQLRDIEGPIDLVGHDWGSGLVLRAAIAYDIPVRSWMIDSASTAHPDYVWHGMAQVWRAPGRGEEWMAEFVAGAPSETAAPGEPAWLKHWLLASCSNPADAAELEAAIDTTMTDCILALYRSATPNLYADWGPELSRPAPIPGAILRATGDTTDDPAASAEVAARLGVPVLPLEGLDHWWMMQDPAAAAAVLRSFWASLDQRESHQLPQDLG